MKQFNLRTLFVLVSVVAVVLAVLVPLRFLGLVLLTMFAPLFLLRRPVLLRIWIATAATMGANLTAFGFASYLTGYGLDPWWWVDQTVAEVCGNGFGLLVEGIAGYFLFIHRPPEKD